MVQKFGSPNMTVLYPIPCYNEVCYIGTVLFVKLCQSSFCIHVHLIKYLSLGKQASN